MKIFLRILLLLAGGFILLTLLRTIFALQIQLYNFPADGIVVDTVFHLILLILSGVLFYFTLGSLVKSPSKRRSSAILFTIAVLLFYFFKYAIHHQTTLDEAQGNLENGESQTLVMSDPNWSYEEKLMSFSTPFELIEQNFAEDNFNNKSRFFKDVAVMYIELDADFLLNTKDKSAAEVIAKFNDLSLPKSYMVTFFKKFSGKEVEEDSITVEKKNDNHYVLNLALADGKDSTMYFVKSGNFFSMLNIIYDVPGSSTAMEIKESLALK